MNHLVLVPEEHAPAIFEEFVENFKKVYPLDHLHFVAQVLDMEERTAKVTSYFIVEHDGGATISKIRLLENVYEVQDHATHPSVREAFHAIGTMWRFSVMLGIEEMEFDLESLMAPKNKPSAHIPEAMKMEMVAMLNGESPKRDTRSFTVQGPESIH